VGCSLPIASSVFSEMHLNLVQKCTSHSIKIGSLNICVEPHFVSSYEMLLTFKWLQNQTYLIKNLKC
jgi:hypothetical protein